MKFRDYIRRYFGYEFETPNEANVIEQQDKMTSDNEEFNKDHMSEQQDQTTSDREESEPETESVETLYLQSPFLTMDEGPPARLGVDYNNSAQIEEFEQLVSPEMFESIRGQIKLVISSEKPILRRHYDLQPFAAGYYNEESKEKCLLFVSLPLLRVLESNHYIQKLREALEKNGLV